MKQVLLAGVACILLSGCVTNAPDGGNAAPAVEQVSDKAAEVAYAAESAWKGALILTNSAVDAGVLKGQQAKEVSAILAQAKAKRDQAWALYAAGNTAAATPLFNQVIGLVASLGTRTPIPKP
jgi:hypothetical protein